MAGCGPPAAATAHPAPVHHAAAVVAMSAVATFPSSALAFAIAVHAQAGGVKALLLFRAQGRVEVLTAGTAVGLGYLRSLRSVRMRSMRSGVFRRAHSAVVQRLLGAGAVAWTG